MKTATAGLRIAKAGAATTGAEGPRTAPRFRQLGGDAGAAGMDFGADMVRDEANDALAVGGRQPFTRVGESLRQAVDPEPPIGVEHHLDDRGSSRNWAIAGPKAVRSMRAPRRIASDFW